MADDPTDVDSQSAALLINLVIGFLTLVISFVLFDVMRRKIPPVFESRRTLHERRDPLDYYSNRVQSPPPPSRRFLGWLKPVLKLELDSVAETHGLDTALYLRFLRTMAAVFTVLLIPTVVLVIVYRTASGKDLQNGDDSVHRPRTSGVQTFSLSNVPHDDSWRFWVALATDYIITVFVLIVIYREFNAYSKWRRRYRAAANPCNYAVLVQDIPRAYATESDVSQYWNRLFPGQVYRVFLVYDAAKLVANKDKFWDAVTNRERAEWMLHNGPFEDGSRPMHKVGFCSCFRGSSSKVDSIKHWTERQQHYADTVTTNQMELNSKYCSPTRAAVVVFRNRRDASIAAQTLFSENALQWRVCRAPEPNAMNWSALSIPGYQEYARVSLTILFSMLLTLFWAIPVTFIMSLANMRALAAVTINKKQPFDFLNTVAGWPAVVIGFIEGLLPAIILSVFLSLIPTFLRIFLSITRVPSQALMDTYVRDCYFNFIIFSNFLYVLLSNSLVSELASILEEPSKTPDLLAKSVPTVGAFMMNFVLLKALSETPLEILQIGRVVVRWLKLTFISKTTRERSAADVGATIFSYFRYYAIAQLIGVIGLIYSSISPLIIPCCLVYFLIMYLVWKYNLCYSLHNTYEDGGRMYGGALYAIWLGVFLHLVTMVGIYGLNRNPAQTALIIIPAALAVGFLFHCLRAFREVSNHGSVLEMINRVEHSEEQDAIPDFVADYYRHPGLVPLPDKIENLNGVESKDGVDEFYKGELADMEKVDPEQALVADPQKKSQNGDDDIDGGDLPPQLTNVVIGDPTRKPVLRQDDNDVDNDGRKGQPRTGDVTYGAISGPSDANARKDGPSEDAPNRLRSVPNSKSTTDEWVDAIPGDE